MMNKNISYFFYILNTLLFFVYNYTSLNSNLIYLLQTSVTNLLPNVQQSTYQLVDFFFKLLKCHIIKKKLLNVTNRNE